jgi:hypothetical protein
MHFVVDNRTLNSLKPYGDYKKVPQFFNPNLQVCDETHNPKTLIYFLISKIFPFIFFAHECFKNLVQHQIFGQLFEKTHPTKKLSLK